MGMSSDYDATAHSQQQSYQDQPEINPLAQPLELQQSGAVEAGSSSSASVEAASTLTKSEKRREATMPDATRPRLEEPGLRDQLVANAYQEMSKWQLSFRDSLNTDQGKEIDKTTVSKKSAFGDLSFSPSIGVSIQRYAMLFEVMQNFQDISRESWEKFNEAIDEQNKLRKDYENSPAARQKEYENSASGRIASEAKQPESAKVITNKGSASFESYITSLTSEEKRDLLTHIKASVNYDLQAGGSEFYKGEYSQLNYASLDHIAVFNGVVVTSSSSMAQLEIDNRLKMSSDQAITSQVSDGVILGLEGARVFIHPTMAAELGLIGGLLAQGVWMREGAAMNIAASSQPKGTHLQTQSVYAKGYSQAIASFVNGKGFESLANFVIAQQIERTGTPMNAETKQMILSSLKINMLATGVAALYQSQFGGMSGKELRELIEQPEQLKGRQFAGIEYYLGALVTLIRAELPQDEARRTAILDGLEESYDRKGSHHPELLEGNQLPSTTVVASSVAYAGPING